MSLYVAGQLGCSVWISNVQGKVFWLGSPIVCALTRFLFSLLRFSGGASNSAISAAGADWKPKQNLHFFRECPLCMHVPNGGVSDIDTDFLVSLHRGIACMYLCPLSCFFICFEHWYIIWLFNLSGDCLQSWIRWAYFQFFLFLLWFSPESFLVCNCCRCDKVFRDFNENFNAFPFKLSNATVMWSVSLQIQRMSLPSIFIRTLHVTPCLFIFFLASVC